MPFSIYSQCCPCFAQPAAQSKHGNTKILTMSRLQKQQPCIRAVLRLLLPLGPVLILIPFSNNPRPCAQIAKYARVNISATRNHLGFRQPLLLEADKPLFSSLSPSSSRPVYDPLSCPNTFSSLPLPSLSYLSLPPCPT